MIETLVAIKVNTAAKEGFAYGNLEVVSIKSILFIITLFTTVFVNTGVLGVCR